MTEPLDQWFVDEILVHEAALLRYLRHAWPRRNDIADMRQEAYVRVYEAAAKARPQSPKSFLFTIARNLIFDQLRHERVVSIEAVGDIDALHVLIDEVTPEMRVDARQELCRLAQALDRLPNRCREVIWLRRVEELSQKQVAERMGVSEKTIEKQIAKGSRLLAAYLFGGSVESAAVRHGQDDDDEHGQQYAD